MNSIHQRQQDLALLDMKQVCERLSFNKSYVFLLVQTGRFPKPIKFGKRASRWVNLHVNNWIAEQVAKADTK